MQGTDWIQKQRKKVNTAETELLARNYAYINNIPVEHARAVNNYSHTTIITETIVWARYIKPEGTLSFPSNMSQETKLTKIADKAGADLGILRLSTFFGRRGVVSASQWRSQRR